MTTTTLTPNGSTALVVSLTGATYQAALTDSSDATFATLTASGSILRLDLSTFTLPTGAVVTSAVITLRASSAGAYISGKRTGTSDTGSAYVTTIGTYVIPVTTLPTTQANIDACQIDLYFGTFVASVVVYEAYLAITYAVVPTVSVTAPTGTVTTTTSPTTSWTYTAGSGGGAQTKYQIRVFTAAQYGAGGFDPATSTAAYDSGIVASSASSATIGPLANTTTYRAYVNVAATTVGTDQWSGYQYTPFATSFTTSDITTVVATADNANARHSIVVTRTNTTPCWTILEVQASYDSGTTWAYVRGYTSLAIPSTAVTATAATDLVSLTSHGLSAGMTVVFAGLTGGAGLTAGTTYFVLASGLTANAFKVSLTSGGAIVDITTDMTAGTMQYALTTTLYDYEAPNGTAATYRARATYLLSSLTIVGAWTSSNSATWSAATTTWLKDCTTPANNITVDVRNAPAPTYDRTVGVFRPIGAIFPIVVSDVRQAETSTIRLRTATAAAETALRLILASAAVHMIQFPSTTGWGWGSRYVVVAAMRESRVIDGKPSAYRWFDLDLIEVDRPADAGIN